MIKQLKKIVRSILAGIKSRPKHLRVSRKLKLRWYGNDYGGFFLYPGLLQSDSIVYSFGIGEDISFDLEVIQKHGCSVYGFDPTPKSIAWVAAHASTLPPNFKFLEYGISDHDGEADFYLPKKANHVSGSLLTQSNVNHDEKIRVKMMSITSILARLNHSRIDVLKMDIEGAEYHVLDSILASNVFIGQILVEFHDRFFTDGREKTKRAIDNMKAHGFELIGVSDSREELSFLNLALDLKK